MIKIIIKWVVIPVGLFVMGICLSIIFFFNSDLNPNIRSHNHESSAVSAKRGMLIGKLRANDNYLSLVAIRFNNTTQLSGDSVFRIKELDKNTWYHTATIAAEQYNIVPLYTFGMPAIAKSKGKTYQFEITGPKLTLSKKEPVLISQYQIPKNLLLADKKLFAEFMQKKVSYYFFGEYAWRVFVVYSIPLLLYFLYLFFGRKIKKNIWQYVTPYFIFLFLCIGIDIFVFRKYTDTTTILFTFLWVVGVLAYGLTSRSSFGAALVFLTFCPFLLWAKMEWVAEKAAVWAYMFLVVGTLQAIIELKTTKPLKINALWFIPRIDSFILSQANNVKKFALFSVKNFIKFVILFCVTVTLLLFAFDFYLRAMSYRERIMRNPVVKTVEPLYAYPSTKIVIRGNRLGDNTSKQYALMKDGKRIFADYWDDKKIIFTVPLGWKIGNARIWIERPIEWNGEIEIEKTKPVVIKLLPVTGGFTKDDDLFFERMENAKKETRMINGYEW